MVKDYNHHKIKMIKKNYKKNGRRFMKLLIFYLLYYDNSYNFCWFSKLRFLQKECNGIHITSSLWLENKMVAKLKQKFRKKPYFLLV